MKKKIILALAIVLTMAVSLTALVGCSDEKMKPSAIDNKTDTLNIAENGKIKVLQLTDMHLTKGRSLVQDKQTLAWVEEAIDKAAPDVVAVTGDAVGSIYGRDQALIQLANLFERKQVYWMYTFGNHDGEWSSDTKTQVGKTGNESGRQELLEILTGYKYSLMTNDDGNASGIGNYIVNFANKEGKVEYSMVNMDSHGKLYDGDKDLGYVGLQSNQVEWYKASMDALKAKTADGKIPPSSLFMHVPLLQFQTAWEDKDNAHIRDFGAIELEGKCYAPTTEVGMFAAIKEKGTSMVTVGHDHMFNWLREYEGVYLSYGRVSGVNAWGRTVPIGATIIEIDTRATNNRDMYKFSVIEPSFEYNSWAGQYKD